MHLAIKLIFVQCTQIVTAIIKLTLCYPTMWLTTFCTSDPNKVYMYLIHFVYITQKNKTD